MIAALDVHYDDNKSRGTGAALLFAAWEDSEPADTFTAVVENIEPYVPGEFYRRELPCLLAVIKKIQVSLEALVIDGYVRLNDRPGLGQHLYERLPTSVPVIGVAKSRFHGARAHEVFRGSSRVPLLVTAIGLDPAEAAERIRTMHGRYRIPTLLKRVDQLARGK